MYYKNVGDSQNSYTRLIFLNEIVSGQSVEYIDDLFLREKEKPLRFDQERCWMCLTGLKKPVYAGQYHLSTNQYMELYVTLERQLLRYFTENGCEGEVFLNLYEDKQIVVIFSLTPDSLLSPRQVYAFIQERFQALYEKTFLNDGRYCNLTFAHLSPISRDQIPQTYQALYRLSDLSFFFSRPGVVTEELVNSLHQSTEPERLRSLRKDIFDAVNRCDADQCACLLHQLFGETLKSAFDYYPLEENLVLLKRFCAQTCLAYDIPILKNLDAVFDHSKYPKIDFLAQGVLQAFLPLMTPANRNGKQYGRIVRDCLRIIKTGYGLPDLSLAYIAEQLNLSASYLSSVFKKEVGSNIVPYILKTRLDKAEELLLGSSFNVGEIAHQVGFENKRYFSECFKRRTGLTPSEYRAQAIGK